MDVRRVPIQFISLDLFTYALALVHKNIKITANKKLDYSTAIKKYKIPGLPSSRTDGLIHENNQAIFLLIFQ